MKVFMWIVIGLAIVVLALCGVVGFLVYRFNKLDEDYLGDSEGEW